MKRWTYRGRRVSTISSLACAILASISINLNAQPIRQSALDQIGVFYAEKARLDPINGKIDSRLRLAVQKATGRLNRSLLPSLRAMEPDRRGRFEVEIQTTDGNGAVEVASWLKTAVHGATVGVVAPRYAKVRAWVPAASISLLAGRADVRKVRSYLPPLVHRINTSQGTIAHRVPQALAEWGAIGAGIKIGVLSDGVDSLGESQRFGDLPGLVTIVPGEQGFGYEGTAMLEIVHDMAPGAELFFATAGNGIESFADNVRALRADYGCDIIVDDVLYFSESPFQDSIVADAVDDVVADGALFFSAAGNQGNANDGTSGTWEGDFKLSSTNFAVGSYRITGVHDFGTNNVFNRVSEGGPTFLQWADPAGASTNDYDVFVLSEDGASLVDASFDTQDGDDDPFEFFITVPGERIVIARASGAVRMLSLSHFYGSLEIATAGTTRGHNCARGAVGVGAVMAEGKAFSPTNVVETFSSDGPRRIFMDVDGNLLPGAPAGVFTSTGGVVRAKPDLAAADGVSTFAPGFDPFYGTSAAAPHAAGVAALVWGMNPGLVNTQVVAMLKGTAIDIEAPGPDRDSGAGIVDAQAAVGGAGGAPRGAMIVGPITASEVMGDGKPTAEPGEIWGLTVPLYSLATSAVLEAKVSLATYRLDFFETNSSYGTLSGRSTNINPTPLTFRIGSNAVNNTEVPIAVAASSLDGGVLFSVFNLKIGAPGPKITNSVAGAAVPIPEGYSLIDGVVEIPFQVAGLANLEDVDFSVDGTVPSTDVNSELVGIAHGSVETLALKLISPSGTECVMIRDLGFYSTNICNLYLDDESPIPFFNYVEAPFVGYSKPYEPLSRFDGEDPNGTWRLEIRDIFGDGFSGRFYAASLILTPIPSRGNATATGSTTAGSSSGGSTSSGSSTGGSTSAGTTAGSSSGGSTGGSSTAGTATGGSTSIGGTTGGTTTGSAGPQPEILRWTIEIKKPRTGKSVRLRSKSGVGTVAGTVKETGLEPKTAGVQVELAFAVSNRVAVPFGTATKIGKVNRKGAVKFLSKKFGAGQELPKGTAFQIWTRATRPGSTFATNTTATNRADYTAK